MDERVPQGLVATFRDDGSRLEETTYQRGVAHGPHRDYWSNGLLACEGQYVNGVQEGEWRFYNPDGTLREVIRFEGGREVVDWDRLFGPTGSDK
jgi:antitoxin component YwqK of YwqJK toxin-antitoxin module